MDIYEMQLTLTPSQVDLAGRWAPSAIFMAMQEAATSHAELLNVGREALWQKGAVFLLARVRYELTRCPRIYETLTIRTWPGPTRHAICPRYFEFLDASGAVIGGAATQWVLVSAQGHRLTTPEHVGISLPENRDIPLPIPAPGKIPFPAEISRSAQRTCCYSDLDINLHMNNTRYVDWVCDLMDHERFLQGYLSALQVNYVSETLPRETLQLDIAEEGDSFSLRGMSGEEERFRAWGRFSPAQ